MKSETVTCDICKKEIKQETSKRPNNVRYFDITPVYSGYESMMYALAVEPTPSEVWCPICMHIIKKKAAEIRIE